MFLYWELFSTAFINKQEKHHGAKTKKLETAWNTANFRHSSQFYSLSRCKNKILMNPVWNRVNVTFCQIFFCIQLCIFCCFSQVVKRFLKTYFRCDTEQRSYPVLCRCRILTGNHPARCVDSTWNTGTSKHVRQLWWNTFVLLGSSPTTDSALSRPGRIKISYPTLPDLQQSCREFCVIILQGWPNLRKTHTDLTPESATKENGFKQISTRTLDIGWWLSRCHDIWEPPSWSTLGQVSQTYSEKKDSNNRVHKCNCVLHFWMTPLKEVAMKEIFASPFLDRCSFILDGRLPLLWWRQAFSYQGFLHKCTSTAGFWEKSPSPLLWPTECSFTLQYPSDRLCTKLLDLFVGRSTQNASCWTRYFFLEFYSINANCLCCQAKHQLELQCSVPHKRSFLVATSLVSRKLGGPLLTQIWRQTTSPST